ncbi:MAG: hypothetical protein KAX49_13055 [Halanaerobiales bacterium]|nr:hypothetical protein [Halanaerobiales bacterium]
MKIKNMHWINKHVAPTEEYFIYSNNFITKLLFKFLSIGIGWRLLAPEHINCRCNLIKIGDK